MEEVRVPDVQELLGRVRVSEDPSKATGLAARLPAAEAPRALSVTDLLEPRRAFWRRRRGPAPVPPERELRFEEGRLWHRRFGDLVGRDAALEVRTRRGGVSARLDVLADVPVEVKTGSAPAEGSEPVPWPEHVEQLALYCQLAGASVGRLVHLGLRDEQPPVVNVVELRFRSLGAIQEEMARREKAIRDAVTADSTASLDRCRWFGTGCEFRAAGICDCRGDEPGAPSVLAAQVERRDRRADLAERWSEAMRTASWPPARAPSRFRDLVHPRRTYFRITAGAPPEPFPARPPASPMDAYERTMAALELGPLGELRRLVAEPNAPDDEVLGWNGTPVLIRSSRARPPLRVDDLKGRFPQYALELGFRSWAAGRSQGTVVVAFESTGEGRPAIQVFDLDFSAAADGFGRLWEARRDELARALENDRPERLEPCPNWMTRDCPYRARCGCADSSGRSQR